MSKPSDGEQISSFQRRKLADDHLERLVCDSCGYVAYENPKIVVGSVVTSGRKILMCKRAIRPRIGYWTLPAGYLELEETPVDGAMREAQEEACAQILIKDLLAVYAIPRISQVQLMYRAELSHPAIAAGPESEEVALFDWQDIPWNDIAFPSVHWALTHHKAALGKDVLAPFTNPPGEEGDRMPPADP